ncbi:MAG: ectonucleotide pyrophosphatase/phosphodiesterase [Clostridium sp.]|nr:ectonucleotide pyrophosphatase/phosphodiesterase [Clostridium sp.]
MRVLVISFDAVSDTDLLRMAGTSPCVAGFLQKGTLVSGVETVFVSNTYPVHTTVATGLPPKDHKIISNLRNGRWVCDSRRIQAKTLWDAAAEKGLRVAAVLWPVTGYAKIRYNVPELHILPGQNQILENLRAGSRWFQLREFMRHRKKLRGITQPYLDDFTTSVAVDVLRRKKPDLTLVHLTAYDAFCHMYGKDFGRLQPAVVSLDRNLGRLLEAAGENVITVIFSDHGQLQVGHTADPNTLAGENETGAFELCGGSAFFRIKKGNPPSRSLLSEMPFCRELLHKVCQEKWFGRFLTEEEMTISGYSSVALFGIAAKPGWCFYEEKARSAADCGAEPERHGIEKGNHGYPTDYEDYHVFYGVRGGDFPADARKTGGRITDVTKLVANVLGLQGFGAGN